MITHNNIPRRCFGSVISIVLGQVKTKAFITISSKFAGSANTELVLGDTDPDQIRIKTTARRPIGTV